MPWETRKGKGLYYTTTVRKAGRRRRIYFGHGDLAELAACLHEAAGEDRREQLESRLRDRERWRNIQGPIRRLEGITELLVAASLLTAGYHLHHGQWRLRLEREREDRE